ncbi:TPA: 23S rRNA (uracil(1939)-C(5))-methyltransferase RlmD [Vibrio diabolicus]|uniref:23S rRNA (uracil(1939)-C(5))-methyltransferase RlmD n=1 Tax=Vibrio diabolicus TaxID=50719 RepID=UPI00080F3D13|nr:23S rRNA (uracil(1939)-C(5))-methyltransferase RlmD [Vibrio diabolicus]MCR9304667.1 23S rRNA (uracil(1939)-C(5))-methyltransferase RlmD [Vibrio diabolicus]MCR9427349.1 23S rRNA (uracil(1939)-C(5))-methyltransferase RlmD [Vibrio diabolicus]MCS0318628.1 23S rRNA (uracil(1939)-C(5))-methyltransferase RlmD [Vibrio diabolicus]MCS0363356.1 23S rRNA (uracil(1939)-C(5))-methyltransferase RlmD [Vibrio diabolicus]MCS0370078.1 23S rRNA (uracil(1939)-C(5))-methyltransferase RlmD [Vibrio diabolicus]
MARIFQPKKKTQLNTRHQAVQVERLDHYGAGIAYLKKKPLFIDGALPGEEVVTQLVEEKSKFARGKLIKILKPSSTRVEPFCPHYHECGGCDLQHLDYNQQLTHKQQTLRQLMRKFSGNDIELDAPLLGDSLAYRRRARVSLFVDKKTRQLHFGFRKKQSKQIAQVTDCPVLAPELNVLLPEIYSALKAFKKPEQLGHVELVLGDNGPCITLRHLSALTASETQSLMELAKRRNASLYLMPATDQLNLVEGDMPFYQEVGVKIPFAPNNFIQVNQAVNQQMVKQAVEWLDPQKSDRVLDLFCGVGNFSLPIAKLAKHVVGVEGVAEMVEKATNNASLNQINNAQFYHANLEQDFEGQVWAAERFDKVLLDPARAGASGIIDQVSELGAQRVVYVSCNPATLARDSQSLMEQGYKLTKLGMLDMFPHTSHLESMALFEKS